MMAVLLLLSILGLLTSVGVHIATFYPSVFGFQYAFLMNALLCAVWTPLMVLGTQKLFDLTTVGEKWKLIPRHAPEWTKGVATALILYAMFNFLFTMIVLNSGGFPAVVDGHMVLHTYNFGTVIEELTPQQYAIHQAYITRVLSGHWIFFFWMGILSSHSHLVEARKRAAGRVSAGSVVPNPAEAAR